jgi:hypothetical protein
VHAVPAHLLRWHGLAEVRLASALEPPKQRELAHTQHLVSPLQGQRQAVGRGGSGSVHLMGAGGSNSMCPLQALSITASAAQ